MISALTVPFAVTLFVKTVLAVFTLHPVGVDIFSLAVNVNTKSPLVHAACVIVHVGLDVSIHFHVTVISFVVSPSVNVITHVSVHVLSSLGVYVILSPFMLHAHLFCVDAVLTLAVIVSQVHALALLDVNQFAVFALFHTFACPSKLLAANATSVHVNVTSLLVTFHALSFTLIFTVCLHVPS